MPGAAHHAVRPRAGGNGGRFERGRQGDVHRHGARLELLQSLEPEGARRGDSAGFFEQRVKRGEPESVLGVANVQTDSRLSSNDVGGAGERPDATDRRHQPRGRSREFLNREYPLRCASERILA